MCSVPEERKPSSPSKSVEGPVSKPNKEGSMKKPSGLQRAENQLRLGTLYGSLSLALLVLSFSLTLPHMQSRRDALGCDSLCLGSMTSARSTLQLLGSALMGRWSDSTSFASWGGARRLCLLVGTLASLSGLLIAGGTYSLLGMWLSMIPGALFQQNFNILKALFSDYHDDIALKGGTSSDRAGSVGALGMSVGLAFMAGPLVGSTLLTSYEQATNVAVVCTVFSGVLIFQIPVIGSSTPERSSSKSKTSPGIWSFLNVPAARSPAAIFLMTIRVCMALAFHIFSTIWTVSLKERFDFGPADHGKFMSFIGLTYALSQGFVAKFLLSKVGVTNNKGRVNILLLCSILLGLGRYIAFQTSNLVAVYIMFAGIVTSLGVVNTVLTADTSQMASSEEIGGLYGILAAVESGAGMMGPILGGAFAYVDPIQAPLFAVVGLYAFVFFLVGWGYERFVLRQANESKML